MNRLTIALCVLSAVLTVTLGDEKYSDKYDNINLEEVLGNDRLLNKYVECLLADTDDKCTEDGKALKRVLSEALDNDCAKCTDKQKSGSQKAVAYIYKNKKTIWDKLVAKFDPTGKFQNKHPELFA